MILRRRVRLFEQRHRFLGDVLDIDAAPAQVLQRLRDGGIAVEPVLAAARFGLGMAARAAAAHGLRRAILNASMALISRS